MGTEIDITVQQAAVRGSHPYIYDWGNQPGTLRYQCSLCCRAYQTWKGAHRHVKAAHGCC